MILPFGNLNTILVFFLGFLKLTHGTPVTSSSAEDEAIRSAKALEMLKYMNQLADPCDDFYKFACGNWHLIHPATVENKQTLYFHQVSYNYMDTLATILLADDPGDTGILKKVKNFYRSCLNVSPVKSVYRDKLMEIVREFGEMPVLEGGRWQSKDFDWLKTIGHIAHKYNKRIILSIDTVTDPTDKTLEMLEIRPSKFALSEFSLYLDASNELYRSTHRRKIAEDLREFLDIEPRLAEQTASDIVTLEVLLVKGIKKDTRTQTLGTDVKTIDDLQEKYLGRLDFKQLLKTSLGAIPKLQVIEKIPSYQENLADIMDTIDKRKVANFVFYFLLRDFMEAARRPEKSPQQSCIYTTRRFFHPFLENMMYHKMKLTQAANSVQNMFTDLKSIFRSALYSDRYNWIGNETRVEAIQKLYAMTIQIDSYDDVNFGQAYDNLEVSSHAFIVNLKNIFTQYGNRARTKEHDAADVMYDETNILFGPGYEIKENRVIIPIISILPHYFWSAAYPHALNLGQLGSTVAHEIVHGFDNNGRYVNRDGTNRQWWDVDSSNNFTLRTQCFRDQYKRYVFGEKPLPDRVDQAENIADNGGVRLAYEAYMTWYDSPWHPKALLHQENLPGLKYTGQQLFFISFAQQWCSEVHPYFKSLLTTVDHHTPPTFRVIGALSNMEEFSTAFQCRPGSGMNPEKKCLIY